MGKMPATENGLVSASTHMEDIQDTAKFLVNKLPKEYQQPAVGIVCGSGLSNLATKMCETVTIPYSEIPNFPVPTVPGHGRQMVVGLLNNVVTVCLLGRFHYYEGFSLNEIAFPIRVISALGVKTVLLTNASGGIDANFCVGDLMVIEDHISFPSLAGLSPLRGENIPLGPRFPAMTKAYHPDSYALVHKAAEEAGVGVNGITRGIYIGVGGPSYETPAEIRLFQSLGGGAVGMSTIPEVIAATHAGMSIVAISLITNVAIANDARTKDIPQPTHEEVLQASRSRASDLEKIVYKLVTKLVRLV